MKASIRYLFKVISIGFIVLLLFSVSLFWVLKLGQSAFYELYVLGSYGSTRLSPSGIVPHDIIKNEPNLIYPSEIRSHIGNRVVSETLGLITDLFQEGKYSYKSGGLNCLFSKFPSDRSNDVVYFDKKLGLFVNCRIDMIAEEQRRYWQKNVISYAGPEGVAQKPSKDLGTFIYPKAANYAYNIRKSHPVTTVYDKKLKQFFSIDFKKNKVRQGPRIDKYNNIDFGYPSKKKNRNIIFWNPPVRKATEEESKDNTLKKRNTYLGEKNILIIPVDGFKWPWEQIYFSNIHLVLTENGTIFRLDDKDLSLGPPVAYIPKPRQLIDYSAIGIEYQGKHLGTATGYITGDAHLLTISAFGRDSSIIKESDADLGRSYSIAGGPLYFACKYIVENLHSPALLLGSFFTADDFEASESHRKIFVMPQAWVAFHSRDPQGKLNPLFMAMLIISPAIFLSSILAFFVYKDTKKIGLSKNARQWWVVLTVAFGISSYITYLLTKPRETLVTCKNCGKLRQPVMETCHHCNSGWEVPQLTPPDWRVMD